MERPRPTSALGTIASDGTVTTVSLRGEIDCSQRSRLRSMLQSGLDLGDPLVNVDLGEVEFLDSSSVAELILFARAAAATHRHFRVGSPTARVQRTLELYGISDLLIRGQAAEQLDW